MILKQILEKVTLKQVAKSYSKFYPDYDDVPISDIFKILNTIIPSKDIDLVINIKLADDIFGEGAYEIYGTNGTYKPNKNGEYYDQGCEPLEEFALEFTKWNDWLNMEVGLEVLKKYTHSEISALCIFEMTLFGNNPEDCINERDYIMDLVKKL